MKTSSTFGFKLVKKLLILSFFIFWSVGFSQQKAKNIDSLLLVLKHAKQDTAKVSLYASVAEHYLFKAIDSSLIFAEKGVELGKKLNYAEGTIFNLNLIGNYYENNVNYAKALEYYNQALQIAKEFDNTKGFAMLYNNIGMVYIRQGKYDEALPLMIDALKAEEKLGNEFGIAQSYNNIGVIYYYQNNLKKATEYLELALEKQEEIGDSQTIKQAINNIGALYDHMQDYEKALEFYNKALDFNTANTDRREMATNLHNIAVTYLKMEDYEKSEEFHQKSFELREEIGDYHGLAIGYFNYGETLRKSDRSKAAKSYFEKGLEIAQNHNIKLTEQYLYGSLAELYKEEKNFQKANEYLYQYIAVKDSILNKENSQIIADVEAKYQTEKKEKELVETRADLAERELKIRQKNNLIFGTSALALILGLIGYLLYNQQKLKNRQLQKENELKEALHQIATQNQLQEQRLQISRDLHDNIGAQLTFIISSLDNIKYGFKLENNKLVDKLQGISSFTSNTIYELRDTIWAMNKTSISVEDLFARITNFMDKAREMSNQVKFSFQVDEEISQRYRFSSVEGMNIYRIIQESVHNALKYSGAKSIDVNIEETQKGLQIKIEDTGIGFDEKTVEPGNGLNNIRKRAKEIKGKITVESRLDKGTVVTLEIPKTILNRQKKAS